LNLLIVSHPCASPINQHLYAEVEQATGWNLTLVVPSNWKNEYGKVIGGGERWPAYRGRLIPVPVRRPGNIILHTYRTRFAALIREARPDAIYVHHEPYALATAQVYWANRRSLRRPIGCYSAQNILKRYPPPFRWTESIVLRRSRYFCPISAEVERVFRQKGYAGPSAVLPLGIDPGVYYKRPAGEALKARLRQRPDEVLIGYLGRIVQEKGLLTLLRGLAGVTDLPWRLVVVGAGPLEAEFDALGRTLGLADRISRIGFVPHEQAPEYLSALDVLVLPSETQPNWKEQFGRVVIEALACGAAVVGSDSGEIPKLIADTGGGLVFPERQPQELADRLAALIRDPALRTRLAETGRQAVEARYALPAIARQFAGAVEAAVAADARSADQRALAPS
jgi:glycosyltransferase involved in cell wall biosynthesis